MEIPKHRRWMDNRLTINQHLIDAFNEGVREFIDFVCAQDQYQSVGRLRCPYKKCKCKKFKLVVKVKEDLCRKGFIENYYYWTNHGKLMPLFLLVIWKNTYYGHGGQREEFNPYE